MRIQIRIFYGESPRMDSPHPVFMLKIGRNFQD